MNNKTLGLLVTLITISIVESAYAQNTIEVDLSSNAKRAETVLQLSKKSEANKRAAEQKAITNTWPIKGVTKDGNLYELIGLDETGKPIYYSTNNTNAAISTAANQVRNTAPYNADGDGHIVGIWDGGAVRPTHQEFGSRVTVRDGASNDDHATHVGGIIGAAGVDAGSQGMAPAVSIYSYDWSSDESEMASIAANASDQPDRIQISNHSYGSITGWANGNWSGNSGPHFWGNFPSEREDDSFGIYDYFTRLWDEVAYEAPYYLPFKSAGNDRNDSAPSNGTTFYYFDGGWQSGTYDAATGPYADNYDGGYDTIGTQGNAKNIMTVGSSRDSVTGGVRDVSRTLSSSFSSYGPSDDGRIKPDITANGDSLRSSRSSSDTAYGNKSGTSMSSPNAAGSAMLLIDLYDQLFPNQSMRASTLKGLILHTADDVWNTGPDYRYGWGLMNTKAAADQIALHADTPSGLYILEEQLSNSDSADDYQFLWDGVSPIKATISWTDPPGTTKSGLDNPEPALVNDLDLRLTAPDGTTIYEPWILDPANPDDPATTGDNILDNTEMVYLQNPTQTGLYTLTVSHKGSLTNNAQVYSLFLNGQTTDDLEVSPLEGISSSGEPGGPFTIQTADYTIQNLSTTTSLPWNISGATSWLDVNPTSGNIAPGGSQIVTVSLNGQANTLIASATPYLSELTITNQTTGVSTQRSFELAISPNYWTEQFGGADSFDLANQMLTLTPVGSTYSGVVSIITSFPTDPTGGTPVSLSDDSNSLINVGMNVSIYGTTNSSLYVNSNGNITLGSGDNNTSESFANHFNRPRISLLYDDLNPGVGGTVSWKNTGDRIAVTFENVPEFGNTNSNSFQAELFQDGRIRMSWLGIDAVDGLVGISDGNGLPGDFVETNISEFVSLGANSPPTNLQISLDNTTPDEGSSVELSATWSDDDAGDEWSVTIDWDDGSAHTVLNNLTAKSILAISHAYGDGGVGGTVRTISVVVNDGTDDLSGTSIVTVQNVPPTANIGGPYSVEEGSTLQLDASASSDPVDTLSFAWDLNDDGIFTDATGVNPTFDATLLNHGNYPIAVRVSDGDETSEANGSVEVLDLTAPTLLLSGSGSPTSENLGVITLTFSEVVLNLGVEDFELTRDSTPIDLSPLVINQQSPLVYTLDLSSLTSDSGWYELSVSSTLADIMDDANLPLAPVSTYQVLVDSTPPESTAFTTDNTLAGGSISGTFTATDSTTSVQSVYLWVKTSADDMWTSRTINNNGTWSYTPTDGDGVYSFTTIAEDALGNLETTPDNSDSGDVVVLYNDIPNSSFSHESILSTPMSFPMTNEVDIILSFTSGTTGGPISVTRNMTTSVPTPLIPERIIDESLEITGTFSGQATITWNYDASSASLLTGDLTTAFQFESGTLINTYPVTPSGNSIVIGPVSQFSDWYTGNNDTEVGDWMILD